jgi:hypothetical protein
MEPVLDSEGYVGYIDVNCIVNNHGIYPLEFTSRFGYPTISIQQAGMTHAYWAILSGPGGWQRSQAENPQWVSNRRARRCAAVSL